MLTEIEIWFVLAHLGARAKLKALVQNRALAQILTKVLGLLGAILIFVSFRKWYYQSTELNQSVVTQATFQFIGSSMSSANLRDLIWMPNTLFPCLKLPRAIKM